MYSRNPKTADIPAAPYKTHIAELPYSPILPPTHCIAPLIPPVDVVVGIIIAASATLAWKTTITEKTMKRNMKILLEVINLYRIIPPYLCL
jgi:tryptophan-rich sensory protein